MQENIRSLLGEFTSFPETPYSWWISLLPPQEHPSFRPDCPSRLLVWYSGRTLVLTGELSLFCAPSTANAG